jgi:hypothetical protein
MNINEAKYFFGKGSKSRFFEASKVFKNVSEMHESEVYNNLFEDFVNTDKPHREKSIQMGRISNWKAFVVDNKIYEVYKISEGFSILKKITVGGCISDSAFNEVFILDDGFAIFSRHWTNNKENRKAFGKTEKVVTTL